MKNWFYLSHPIGFIDCAFTIIFILSSALFFILFFLLLLLLFYSYREDWYNLLPMRFFFFFSLVFSNIRVYLAVKYLPNILYIYIYEKGKNKYLPIIYELPFWTLLAIPSIAFPTVPITFEIIEANMLSLPKIFSNGNVAIRAPFFFKLNKIKQTSTTNSYPLFSIERFYQFEFLEN